MHTSFLKKCENRLKFKHQRMDNDVLFNVRGYHRIKISVYQWMFDLRAREKPI